MENRVVIPEILDSLPLEDSSAIRSRRDLRRINFLMGNDRWIRSVLAENPDIAASGIIEIGAGEGSLLQTLSHHGKAVGVDLLPPPTQLHDSIGWVSGDITSMEELPRGGVLIANLFLHHFESDALQKIGELCEPFEMLILSEPFRSQTFLALSRCITPFVGSVTRHDMPVSIRAGFTMGELPTYLGLPDHWQVFETTTALGAIRTIARKRS